MWHVLIDPGHGRETPGKRSPAATAGLLDDPLCFFEYASNRELAGMVGSLLAFQGIDVHILVPEEWDVPLKERTRRVNEYCRKWGVDHTLLLSIHTNAAKSGKVWTDARGWCAFTSPGKTKADLLATEMYKLALVEFYDPNREYIHTFYLGGAQKPVRCDWSDGDEDKEACFWMLTQTNCPAVLVENFFQDNKLDVAYLKSDKGKGSCAYVMSEGILNYIAKYGTK